MNILTIDTVLNKTYIALLIEGKKTFLTLESDEKNYHSAYLAEKISEFPLNKIEYIGTNTGVGSFTGIRAGLTFVKVISDRLKIKAVPFNTFEVLEFAFKTKNILLDARRGQAFYLKNGNIEMIPYTEAEKLLDDKKFICDNSILEKFKGKNLISYEKEGPNAKNLAPFELELVTAKINEGKIIDSSSLKPTYIQTPPIFMKQ